MGYDGMQENDAEFVRFTALGQAVDALSYGGPHNPDRVYETVGQYWEDVMAAGNKYFEETEIHFEVDEQLTDEFKNTDITEIGTPEFTNKFEEECACVLEAVNEVYQLAGIHRPDHV